MANLGVSLDKAYIVDKLLRNALSDLLFKLILSEK